MTELGDFYRRYIAAFNACDHDAFAAFFHPPVTVLHATGYDERRAGRALAVLDDLSTMASRPVRWSHTTVDNVSELSDVGPSLDDVGRLGSAQGLAPARPGLITLVTRWDNDGDPYQRIRALYLLTREQGRLGIKVLAELEVDDLT
jgi:hypothetical protein